MPNATSPTDQLAQLKQELADKQTDNAQLAQEIDQLKAQIADLTKTVSDIDQKTGAYQKASDAVASQVKDLKGYVTTEKTMLKAALPPSAVTDVENKKSTAQQELKDLANKLNDATDKVATADKAYSAAKDGLATAQAGYKSIADLPTTNADILKDVTALRTAADKQGAANSLGRQYFLVLIMDDRLNQLNLLTPEDYSQKLNDAGSAVAQASDAQTTAKNALDSAVAAQKQAQTDLTTAKANWRQQTLDSIPETPAATAASALVRAPAAGTVPVSKT